MATTMFLTQRNVVRATLTIFHVDKQNFCIFPPIYRDMSPYNVIHIIQRYALSSALNFVHHPINATSISVVSSKRVSNCVECGALDMYHDVYRILHGNQNAQRYAGGYIFFGMNCCAIHFEKDGERCQKLARKNNIV